jgi:beta-N-acetylhexosaminidase
MALGGLASALSAGPVLTPTAASEITTTLPVLAPLGTVPSNGTSTAGAGTRNTACLTAADVDAWPIERKAGHIVMVGLDIKRSAFAAELVNRYNVGGILIRGVPGSDTKTRLAKIAASGAEAPAIAVDEEGGRVQHLKAIVGTLPSARVMGSKFTPTQVQAMAKKHGAAMKALGFTMVFAPVLDLNGPKGNGIGDRAFSADPAVVSEYGTAFSRGFAQSGIFPVLKHFPGHGRASGDTHNVGASTPPLAEMRAMDMVPFANVTRAVTVGVMTAHLQVPGSDGQQSSLSPMLTEQVLRGDLGFEGLVITDSLSMWSIRYNFNHAQAAVRALGAGADVMLFDDLPKVDDITSAITNASNTEPLMKDRLLEANLRFLRAKGRLCPDVVTRRTPRRLSPPVTTTPEVSVAPNAPSTTRLG